MATEPTLSHKAGYQQMKHIIRTLIAAGLVFACIHPASALTVAPPTFEELVQKAETVIQSEVVSTRSEWVGSGAKRHIVTHVRVKVEECIVGEAADEAELTFFGGKVGDEGMEVAGMPVFAPGDRDILFVRNNGKSFCPLVAAGYGRYLVVQPEKSAAAIVARSDGTPLSSPKEVSKELSEAAKASATVDQSVFLTLDAFKAAIVAVARSQGKTVDRQAK